MTPSGDLTTLPHVKEWLGIPLNQTESDVLLTRLITSASRFILNYINRNTLVATVYNDRMDGYGKNFMLIRQWPVIKFNSASFGGLVLATPALGNPPTNGFLLESADSISGGQQRLMLFGYVFAYGKGQVVLNYVAGYQITDEPQTIPATPFQVTTDFTWIADTGVTFALTGMPLVKVTGTPTAGQYAVDDAGVYTFAAADTGLGVLITYSYVPPDLEQACWEMIGERYLTKDRIGVKSKVLGGQETIVYNVTSISDFVKSALQPFVRVTPQ